ncbi:MAG TPA: VTT domain-containing protein [Actinomycetaceae bacterium]|nr:VTT domain-containing protein [Actinomycetaceae bacterium]
MCWLETVLQWFSSLNDLVLSAVDQPWVLLVLIGFTIIDGFFPAVPSESIVIAVAAVSATGVGPPLWALILAAALGAFLGDQIAFTIGRLIPIERIPFLTRGRGAKLIAKVNATVFRRPAPLLIAGRFIPGGRVAVNISAGAMHFPRIRFVQIDIVAALLWAIYSTILGLAASAYLKDHPALSVAVGVGLGVMMGMLIERVHRLWETHRERAAEREERSESVADLSGPAED